VPLVVMTGVYVPVYPRRRKGDTSATARTIGIARFDTDAWWNLKIFREKRARLAWRPFSVPRSIPVVKCQPVPTVSPHFNRNSLMIQLFRQYNGSGQHCAFQHCPHSSFWRPVHQLRMISFKPVSQTLQIQG
jgi:hypothetical protein